MSEHIFVHSTHVSNRRLPPRPNSIHVTSIRFRQLLWRYGVGLGCYAVIELLVSGCQCYSAATVCIAQYINSIAYSSTTAVTRSK